MAENKDEQLTDEELAQLQLAEECDLSRTHISNLEAPNMPTSISLEALFDIADVLEVPIK